MSRKDHLHLVTKAANLYFVKKERQIAIANRLEISQSTVSRLVKEAIKENLVIFKLNSNVSDHINLEEELRDKYNWQSFQHKHHESRFTRFYEDYWLPRRFGFEKRRAHFSSLIMTGQMSRENALERISKSEMSEHFLEQEFDYVAHKLGLSTKELGSFFNQPKKYYYHFKNKRWIISLGTNFMRYFGLERRFFR